MMTTAPRRKKTLSPDQQAASAARKAALRTLCTTVSKMSETERAAMASRMAGVLTCEGRSLSAFNCCLLMLQREDVTIVGGFQQWLRAGRCVTKGEHGLAIWIPLGTRDDDTGRVEMHPDDRRFLLATVFDVTQTHVVEEPTS